MKKWPEPGSMAEKPRHLRSTFQCPKRNPFCCLGSLTHLSQAGARIITLVLTRGNWLREVKSLSQGQTAVRGKRQDQTLGLIYVWVHFSSIPLLSNSQRQEGAHSSYLSSRAILFSATWACPQSKGSWSVAPPGGDSEGHLVPYHDLSRSHSQVLIKLTGCENPMCCPPRLSTYHKDSNGMK